MYFTGWIKREYSTVQFYYRESLTCLAIFVVAVYAGYILAVLQQDRADQYYRMIREIILANPFGQGMPDNLFLFILARNSLVSFSALVLGIFTYNLWPVLILLLNGVITGFAVKMQALLFQHYTFKIWLFGLLPHGIPELGALFLACGASFYYRRLSTQGEKIWGRVWGTYLLVVWPLLVLAALLESFITPLLIFRFLV